VQEYGSKQLSADDVVRLREQDLLAHLHTSTEGLTSAQAQERLTQYGHNDLGKKKRKHFVVELLHHFKSPLIIILLIATIISFIIGQTIDATIIAAMILLSVLLDFIQEHRAEHAAEALERRISTTSTVLRDKKTIEIPLTLLVPGDIIHLSAGDIIPADCRIITAKDFFVDQSALTGESFPLEKHPEAIAHDTGNISTWSNYLFMGTAVVSGSSIAVVVKTGQHTEYGAIVRKSLETRPETEFERGLDNFGLLIMKTTLILVAFVFITQALFKNDILTSLLFAIALAVGLTPELLPMILSINLSKGAVAMSHKGVIVKRLASI